jgi:hypothetical protein
MGERYEDLSADEQRAIDRGALELLRKDSALDDSVYTPPGDSRLRITRPER